MYKIREVVKDDLDYILECRNRPEIRKNMYNYRVITKEEHYSYFENVFTDKSKKYFICEDKEGLSVGVVCFVDINMENKTSSWAFYSSDINRRGVGTWMEYLALNYGFEKLKLHKLNCEVLDFNYKVVEFHLKFGFQIEGIFKKSFLTKEGYSDIYRLSIFAEDWLKYQKRKFYNLLEGKDLIVKEKEGKLKIGEFYEEKISISEDDISNFAKITGDYNPVHFSDKIAKEIGFSGKICHGSIIEGIISCILGTKFPGKGTIYLGNTIKFLKPVYPNLSYNLSMRVIRKVGRKVTIDIKVHDEEMVIIIESVANVLEPK